MSNPETTDAEMARLRAEVDRLLSMRDEDEEYMIRQAKAQQMLVARLRQDLASARASHEMQLKCTLAFREDWMREKARADALEAGK